jgi:hypothetical protein
MDVEVDESHGDKKAVALNIPKRFKALTQLHQISCFIVIRDRVHESKWSGFMTTAIIAWAL